ALVVGLRLEPYLIQQRPRLSANQACDVTNLGVAGMLHDIGKSKLPSELANRNVLSEFPLPGEREEWEAHAREGFEMIRGEVDPTVAATVLNHHQRFDGKGFPARVRDSTPVTPSGTSIHVFARILGAADLFERLSEGPSGRRTNFEVLHLMQTRYAGWLDPDVLRAMPQVIPPFSPGRRVKLSDGAEGIVVGFHPYSPYQPVVKRLDNGKIKAGNAAVDLRDTQLEIVELDGTPLDQLRVPPEKREAA
ncbi:MAG TPA: HD domain-containing phosphohydrolase, partial [Tepidisphaeraceae bacterium]